MMANLPILEPRGCGPCDACCTWLPIPEGVVQESAKPVGDRCPHLDGHGCSIYGSRPKACREFSCAWLNNLEWPQAWRPHESGLLCLKQIIDNATPVAVVYEIRAGALLEPGSEALLVELVQTTSLVAVVSLDQRRWLLEGAWRADAGGESMRPPHFKMARRAEPQCSAGSAERNAS